MITDRYINRGVSAGKEDVHAAIKKLDKGLYPNAFCKILPDYVGGDADYCNIMHTDTAGTKTSLAYIYWKETGDLSVWKGIVQDAIVMNIDDMACVGCVDDIVISSNIARNQKVIPGEVIKAIIEGTEEFCEKLRGLGINIRLAGGETADVGDIIRTIDVGYTAFARMRREQLISCNMQSGDKVIGLASYGQTSYEDEYNSGIGCNGLTSARHDLFTKQYASKYPESFDSQIPEDLVYCGKFNITDEVEGLSTNIGKAVLSPTRTYIPIIKTILEKYRNNITGVIHCTGGGQTKVGKFIDSLKVVKNNMLTIPPLFELIQKETQTSWEEMFNVFNMGTRLEIYAKGGVEAEIINDIKDYNIDADVIGYCEENTTSQVKIVNEVGEFTY